MVMHREARRCRVKELPVQRINHFPQPLLMQAQAALHRIGDDPGEGREGGRGQHQPAGLGHHQPGRRRRDGEQHIPGGGSPGAERKAARRHMLGDHAGQRRPQRHRARRQLLHGQRAGTEVEQAGGDLRRRPARDAVFRHRLPQAISEKRVLPMPPDLLQHALDRAVQDRAFQNGIGQRVAGADPVALRHRQFKQIGHDPPFDLLRYIGAQQDRPVQQPLGPLCAEFASGLGPHLHRELRGRERQVQRRAGDIPADGGAMQGQGTRQGKVAVDERPDACAPGREVTARAVLHGSAGGSSIQRRGFRRYGRDPVPTKKKGRLAPPFS